MKVDELPATWININASHKHNIGQKTSDKKGIYVVWFYLYKIQKHTKLNNCVRDHSSYLSEEKGSSKWKLHRTTSRILIVLHFLIWIVFICITLFSLFLSHRAIMTYELFWMYIIFK